MVAPITSNFRYLIESFTYDFEELMIVNTFNFEELLLTDTESFGIIRTKIKDFDALCT